MELQEDPMLQEYLAKKFIVWKHQKPRAPGKGGHLERLVRTIKASLFTAIAKKLFNWKEFMTITKEVETIVNSRPLTYQGMGSQDIPLSPSQLVWGQDLTLLPPLLLPDHIDDNSYYEAKAVRHQYHKLSSALGRFRQ